jgi:hypothetical protein
MMNVAARVPVRDFRRGLRARVSLAKRPDRKRFPSFKGEVLLSRTNQITICGHSGVMGETTTSVVQAGHCSAFDTHSQNAPIPLLHR